MNGYRNFKTNEFVSDEYAYEYALDQSLYGSESDKKDFRQMLVEWYFSGGCWVKEREKEV